MRSPPITELLWDEHSVEHIARHHVTAQEVEEVCFKPQSLVFKRGARYIVLGQTAAGRYLFVAVDRVRKSRGYVVTARSMDKKERRRYHREVHL